MAKAPAFDGRAYMRKNMLARHGMTEADLAPKQSEADREAAELAALPKSLAEAKGDGRAYMKADMRRRVAAREGVTASTLGRTSMVAELRKQGLEPAR